MGMQIKILEKLVAKLLEKSMPDAKLLDAFKQMRRHFWEDDYLYDYNHCEIIKKIYLVNAYANGSSVLSLTQDFHCDNKTLLDYRKAYINLIAAHYLEATTRTESVLALFYAALKKLESQSECESLRASA